MEVTVPMRSVRVEVADSSAVGTVRRAAMKLAEELGFDESESTEVGIVANEAATNLVKHAERGEVFLRELPRDPPRNEEGGVEILALDRGPGIPDIPLARRDGWSTAGSLGGGLGAIARLSQRSDMYSRNDGGSILLAQLRRSPAPTARAVSETRVGGFEVGAVAIARAGEVVSGDAWNVDVVKSRARVFVVDGLGHGPDARRAAQAAIDSIAAHRDAAPARALELVHAALRPTRGAAALLIDVDAGRGTIGSCGVGNVAAAIVWDGGIRRIVSHNGTLGQGTPRFQEFQYPWPLSGLLLVHTDGIATRWNLDSYPGLFARHPALAAGVLYRDFCRGTDDATVVALKGIRP